MAHSSKSGGTGTTFRLGHEDRQELEERAAAADQTLSEYLRELVREHLEPTEMGKLLDEVEGLRIEVRMLREDMQFVLETLLINVANIPDDQVKSAVRAKLKRP
jgi:predicted DNA-binding protein